jgi:hypothetical protein
MEFVMIAPDGYSVKSAHARFRKKPGSPFVRETPV